MKRVFDIVFSLFGLVLVLPLSVPIALAIKVDSPGPVLYMSRRTGRYGRPFLMYKLRSMVVDAPRRGGSSSSVNDPRITRVGRFLRRFELDELPQLFNVLKGDMSIVGPRPEVEEYTGLYTEEEQVILTVRPGMTDYASIRFIDLNRTLARTADPDKDYAENVRPEKNRLRLKYARRNSLLIDAGIMLATLRRLVTHKWSTKS